MIEIDIAWQRILLTTLLSTAVSGFIGNSHLSGSSHMTFRRLTSSHLMMASGVTSQNLAAQNENYHLPISSSKQFSLAGSCLVVTNALLLEWSLLSIDGLQDALDDAYQHSEGAKSWAALHLQNFESDESILLKAHIQKKDRNVVGITISATCTATIQNTPFQSVLSKIMAQWAIRRHLIQDPSDEEAQFEIILQDASSLIGNNKIVRISSSALNDSGMIQKLLFPVESSEIVEMVDRNGQGLGCVPRQLVHKYNILHRGIGIFVTKDNPIVLMNNAQQPPIYVHQRSHFKSIFPSLYDMFVGGVSLAGEASLITACREVAEELGLEQALDNNEQEEKLIGPFSQCVVCTAYNRCVVDMFSYVMNTTTETVSWQEEEVAWGSFVPYHVICDAADRSIQRLASKQRWPGAYPPVQSKISATADEVMAWEKSWENNDESRTDYKQWDFVPDGLLVWEAWLQLLTKA